jgi:hypothetical protein
VRAFEKPADARHVRIDFSEQVRRGVIADEFQRLPEMFEREFVVPFVNFRERDAEVGFGQTAPVARAAKVFESLLRVVARDGVLVDVAIDTRERDVDRADLRAAAVLRRFAQRAVQDRDGLRVIARVVVGEAELDAEIDGRDGVALGALLRLLVHLHRFERFAITPLHLQRRREQTTRARQQHRILPRGAHERSRTLQDFGSKPLIEQQAHVFKFALKRLARGLRACASLAQTCDAVLRLSRLLTHPPSASAQESLRLETTSVVESSRRPSSAPDKKVSAARIRSLLDSP